jgi:hypothetical protein
MSPLIIALISIRSTALAADLAGRSGLSDQLYGLADAIDAGRATDAHMALVAEKLKSRDITDADVAEVMARIDADSAELRAPG